MFNFKKNKPTTQKRAFKSAKINRLTNDWANSVIHINNDLKRSLKLLKIRCREAAKNNPNFKKYIRMRQKNIVGHAGFTLNCQVKEFDGRLDSIASNIIEKAYKNFSSPKNFTVTAQMSRRDLEKYIVSALAYDGEMFIRRIKNFDGNQYRYSLQCLDSYLCDIDLNTQLSNGNFIVNGVEINEWGRPLNYYFRKSYPDRYTEYTDPGYSIIPADEMIHLFYIEFPGQTRGIPMGSISIFALNQLDGYTEAEIIAARLSASKMGFYTVPDGHDSEEVADERQNDGSLIQDFEPGLVETLPEGWGFTGWDPKHPTGNHANFIKANMREIANGWDVSYNELANDLEGVNFSSIRQGVLSERESWMDEQEFLIEHFEKVVFADWLQIALLNQNLAPLPYSKLSKFQNSDNWLGRRWTWVDPLKDAKTNEIMVQHHWKTDDQVAAESGADYFDNLQTADKNAQEKAKFKNLPENQIEQNIDKNNNNKNEEK